MSRAKMLTVMQATLKDEQAHHDWTYDAVRPMIVPPRWLAGQHVRGDCSKGCQFIARWGGAPDPMGMGFGPYGNSTTMTAHLPHLDHPTELKVGDYVTFGLDGDDHATVVMKAGNNPLLWSFGHQGAPDSYLLSFDKRERHFLHNPVSTPPLTAAEKLRLKTGYWSWLQWRLGEGFWRGYGKRNKNVRPAVPRRIKASWLRRYVRFLRNRKRAANLATT